MNDNPSRSADPRLPVESVTWPEAKTFCTRLSWLLGLPVRLPTAAELSRAARDPAWPRSQAGTGRSLPTPVTAAPDEAENFTEWLESAGQESSVAPVAGGGAPGLVPSLSAAATSVLREKTLRSRLIGFRIVLPSP
jgi:formylglycine-generating enzyme required for sulfatase activity